MSEALTVFQRIDSSAFKQELARALPNTLKPDRMVRLALTLLKKNDALQKCDPISVMACVVEIAQLGLEPEGVLGHAYMVPFGGQATLIVGYRGFMHLMYQSGVVQEISAEIVRKGDGFKRVLGTRRELIHEPAPIPKKDDEENWIGAYAACTFLNGTPAFEYLEKVKIYQARARSRGYQRHLKEGKSTPWVTDAEEMWKKTPIRRLAKRMPMSTTDKRAELLRAVMLDEYGEKKDLLIPTLSGFQVNPDPPEQTNGEPIVPTIEVDASDSTSSTEEPKEEVSTKKAKPTPAQKAAVPKAAIPKEKPVDDPFITTAEQTNIYNKGAANGWKVPDEVKAMLIKRFRVDSVRLVRRSMMPEILRILESGT